MYIAGKAKRLLFQKYFVKTISVLMTPDINRRQSFFMKVPEIMVLRQENAANMTGGPDTVFVFTT
jgi:hypothetical protein